jgi:hypothetical protein
VIISASLEQSSGSAQVVINGPAPPTVFHLDHITPNVGDPAGGIHATIFGQGFLAPIAVTFNGSTAQVLSVDPDHAVVVVPRSAAPVPVGTTLAVNVSVSNGIGSTSPSSDTLVNGFVYSNGGTVVQPQVFSVTPTTGPQEGHTQVVINGNGFQQPVQVLFRFASLTGLDLEAPIVDATPGKLVVLTPDIRAYVAAGTLVNPVIATIRVINLNSGFATDAAQTFAYGASIRITSVAPGTVAFNSPTLVTIFGSGFDEPVAVSVDVGGTQVAQQVISVSGTEIVIRSSVLSGGLIPPCGGATTGTVKVTNIEGGATATGGGLSFTGPPRPLILGVSPNFGPAGTAVVINGSGFPPQSSLRVLFGGATGSSASVSSSTSTSINATVPTPPLSFTFATQACDANADTLANGTQSIPTPIDITVRDLLTNCEGTLSNAFTLNPPTAACVNDTVPTGGTTQCNDGTDNDGDTFIDFPSDLGCTSATSNNERTACQNGVDDDGDTLIDFPADGGCSGVQDTTETP